MASAIEDYALIGDCRTAALVGRDGSIDWLCLPRFDSAALFAALLGTPGNGRWVVAPRGDFVARRQYDGNTMVLETTFETETGAAKLTDFMPIGSEEPAVVRLLTGLSGKIAMHTEFVARFDYGYTIPWVVRQDDETHTVVAGPDMLVLRTPVNIRGKDMRSVASFTIREGETIPFVLHYGRSHLPVPAPIDVDAALKETQDYWRGWAGTCNAKGKWNKLVRRSLVTLKALSYRPTGGMVAAVTTSLPEQIGSTRNWDYRYCWLRDATLTLLAFLNAGYREEANTWQNWLLRAISGSPDQLQIMYGVGGERHLDEWEIPWLKGYADSRPVRVGNGAAKQLQLDVYGELADVLEQAERAGLEPSPRRRELRMVFLKHLERQWRKPDEGIWEIRGAPQHFTHSKAMAWVAFDRAARGALPEREEELRRHWRAVADEIHEDVCRNGVDADRNCFVQAYGSGKLDASLLMLPIVGFLPATDPRIRNTVTAIEQTLISDGLVLRYRSESEIDGLPPGEGAFLACSFWLADNYILQGRIADAEKLFTRLVRLCNDVGLLAEEYDMKGRRMLGNFPQAFSHVALVNTALSLMQARATNKKPELKHKREAKGK